MRFIKNMKLPSHYRRGSFVLLVFMPFGFQDADIFLIKVSVDVLHTVKITIADMRKLMIVCLCLHLIAQTRIETYGIKARFITDCKSMNSYIHVLKNNTYAI